MTFSDQWGLSQLPAKLYSLLAPLLLSLSLSLALSSTHFPPLPSRQAGRGWGNLSIAVKKFLSSPFWWKAHPSILLSLPAPSKQPLVVSAQLQRQQQREKSLLSNFCPFSPVKPRFPSFDHCRLVLCFLFPTDVGCTIWRCFNWDGHLSSLKLLEWPFWHCAYISIRTHASSTRGSWAVAHPRTILTFCYLTSLQKW